MDPFLLLMLFPLGVAIYLLMSVLLGRWSEKRRWAAHVLIFTFLFFLSGFTLFCEFGSGLNWMAHDRLNRRYWFMQPNKEEAAALESGSSAALDEALSKDNSREIDGVLSFRELAALDAHAAEAYRHSVNEEHELGASFMSQVGQVSALCTLLLLTSITGLSACLRGGGSGSEPEGRDVVK